MNAHAEKGETGIAHVLVAMLICMLVCMLVGLINGVIVAKFQIPAMLVTLGMQMVLTGIALGITKGGTLSGYPVLSNLSETDMCLRSFRFSLHFCNRIRSADCSDAEDILWNPAADVWLQQGVCPVFRNQRDDASDQDACRVWHIRRNCGDRHGSAA